MNEKKRAVPGRDGRRTTQATTQNAVLFNNTISSKYNQDWIVAALLKPGKENAITAQDLAAMMGLSEARTISQLIYNERINGAPICACSRGYYLPETPEEFGKYLSGFTRRFISTKKTLDALKRTQRIVEGQTEIENQRPAAIFKQQMPMTERIENE